MFRELNLYDAQQALGWLRAQQEIIEPEVYETQYVATQYQDLVPINTGLDEWAQVVTYYSIDRVGQAEWFHHAAKDVPYADVERDRYQTTIAMAAIGYEYDLEEINQARRVGVNITSEKAASALEAYEQFMDSLALYGDVAKGFKGLINNSTVTAGTAPADGAGGLTTFPSKTSGQVIRDFNTLVGGIYIDSKTIEMADTVLMSLERFNYLATTPRSDSNDETILEYVMRANVLTVTTGRQLRIRAVLGLETAGASNTQRMIAYRYDPKVLKLQLPMPHRFLPAANVPGSIIYKVPGLFRTGGTDILRPPAVRYLDGI